MRPAVLVLLSALLSLPALAPAQTPAPTPVPNKPAYESDPRFVDALADAKRLMRKHDYFFAREAYLKANKISGDTCTTCLDSLFDLNLGLAKYKDAQANASRLVELAPTPTDKSIAETKRARALLMQAGDKPKPPQLDAVHAVLQTALTEYPRNLAARWEDACVLARMGQLDKAASEFSACADTASSNDPMRVRARHFAENPSLSLAKMAPGFEVTASDGSRFNLDNMGGRVVLIDFWATWCGPCNAELPHMKKIAKEFANDPLVIISISWDKDADKWKQFIDKNEMTWLQYRDADHKLSERFGVNAIPHYFTIDSDGVLTAEMLGEGADVEGKLKKLIKRARESKPPAVAATPTSIPTSTGN